MGLSRTYELGDDIPLEDFLALPPDGRRLARDERGRLCPMPPDHPGRHRTPISRLSRWLNARLPDESLVIVEPDLALPRIVRLGGRSIPESRLGPRRIEPDLAVFDDAPEFVLHAGEAVGYGLTRLRLVVEVLSPSTWRADLGVGQADDVDRWRSYLLSGVPEVWLLNPGAAGTQLPASSGLFLRNDGQAWAPLEVIGPTWLGERVNGQQPLTAGRVRSGLGHDFDVGAFFADVARLDALGHGGSADDGRADGAP